MDSAEMRQVRLVMFMLDELAPGCVCLDSACPTGENVPHMANDSGPHPRPYGMKPPWSARAIAKARRDRKKALTALEAARPRQESG